MILSLRDTNAASRLHQLDSLGAVPIGVLLIVGPAVVTTPLILASEHGYFWLLPALVLNIVIACSLFLLSAPIIRLFDKAGTRVLSGIFGLIPAAIAGMRIRKGIMGSLTGSP